MLAERGVPQGDGTGWLYEPKWDGYRAIVYVDGIITIRTRRGLDRTSSFPELGGLAEAVDGRRMVLDGELVACRDGVLDFYALSGRLAATSPNAARQAARRAPVTFVAFDLLWLDGDRLTRLPLVDRKAALGGLDLAGPAWQTTAWWADDGEAVFAACEQRGLEGLVAKRAASPYRPGKRSKDWLKRKTAEWREVHDPRRHEAVARSGHGSFRAGAG